MAKIDLPSVTFVYEALSQLGEAPLSAIYSRVDEISARKIPHDSIRRLLQAHCSESKTYKPGELDLFESVHGIDAREGVWRLREIDPLSPENPDSVLDGVEADIEEAEGRAVLRVHLRRERSSSLINRFKKGLHSFACVVCEFDFEQEYGELGAQYIEAHHVKPVSQIKEGEKTNPKDLIALCANCHRMVHRMIRRDGLISIDELRTLRANRKR